MRRRNVGLSNQLQTEKRPEVKPAEPIKHLKTKAGGKTDFFTKNAKFFRINFQKMLAVSD